MYYMNGGIYASKLSTPRHLEEMENPAAIVTEAKIRADGDIAVGSDIKSNERTLESRRSTAGFVYAALGGTPGTLRTDIEPTWKFIKANIDKAIAVGEVGLNYHKKVRAGADKTCQKRALAGLLKIAKEKK